MVRHRVREVAEARGLDIAKLSRRADISYRTAFRLFHEPELDVSLSTLEKVAKALDVRVKDLIANGEEAQDGQEG